MVPRARRWDRRAAARQRANPGVQLAPFAGINSAPTAVRNIKQETAKLLEGNAGKPGDLGYGGDCLDVITRTRPTKEITEERNFTQMKTSRLRKASPEHVPAGTTAAHDTTWRPSGDGDEGGRQSVSCRTGWVCPGPLWTRLSVTSWHGGGRGGAPSCLASAWPAGASPQRCTWS